MNAFVLIEVSAGKVKDVLSSIKKLKEVEIAEAVVGPYDIISYVRAKDIGELGKIVVGKIQGIPGVQRTLTAIAVEM